MLLLIVNKTIKIQDIYKFYNIDKYCKMSENMQETQTETLLDYDNLKRQKREFKSKIESWKASKELLEELPNKISYKVNAPINKVCFVQGKIINSNQVYIKYDDYLIQKSCKDAQISQSNKIDSYNDQINLIDNFLKQVSAVENPEEEEEQKRGDEFNITETLEESQQYKKDQKPKPSSEELDKQCMFITDAKDFLEKEEPAKLEKQCMFISDAKEYLEKPAEIHEEAPKSFGEALKTDEQIIITEKKVQKQMHEENKSKKVGFVEDRKEKKPKKVGFVDSGRIENPNMNFESEIIVDPDFYSEVEGKKKQSKTQKSSQESGLNSGEKPEDVSITKSTPGEHNMDHLQKMLEKAQGFGTTKSKAKIEQERIAEESRKRSEHFAAQQKIKDDQQMQEANQEIEDEQLPKKSLFRQRMEKRG